MNPFERSFGKFGVIVRPDDRIILTIGDKQHKLTTAEAKALGDYLRHAAIVADTDPGK